MQDLSSGSPMFCMTPLRFVWCHRGFNRSIKDKYDHLNAAMVGYARTEKGMAEPHAHGNGFGEGQWRKTTLRAVVDLGRKA